MNESTSHSRTLFPTILLLVLPPVFFGARGSFALFLLVIFSLILILDGINVFPIGKPPAEMPRLSILLLLMGVLSVISLAFSVYKRPGYTAIAVCLLYGYIFLRAAGLRNRAEIRKLFNLLAGVSALIAVYALTKYALDIESVLWLPLDKNYSGRITGTFANPNHTACFWILTFPLAVYLAAGNRGYRRIVWTAASALIFSAGALTFSRGSLLSMAVQLLFVSIIITALLKKLHYFTRIMAVLALLCVFAGGILQISSLRRERNLHTLTVDEHWKPGTGDAAFEIRYTLAQDTIDMISDHPLTGSGPGTFDHIYPAYRSPGIYILANAAHNDYLQLASEFGLPFLILFLLFIVAILKDAGRAIYKGPPADRPFVTAAFLSFIGFCAFMLVDFNLRIPANGILFFFISGCIVAMSRDGTAAPPAVPGLRKAVSIFMIASGVVILAASSSWTTAYLYHLKSKAPGVKKQPGISLEYSRKALALDPQNYDYALYVSQLMLELAILDKNPAGIKSAVEMAIESSGMNVFDGRSLAVAATGEALLGLRQDSKKHLLEAIDRNPRNAGFMDNLVLLLTLWGDKDDAIEWVERSCAVLPLWYKHYFLKEEKWDAAVFAAAARGLSAGWRETGDFEAVWGLIYIAKIALKKGDCEIPLAIGNSYLEYLPAQLDKRIRRRCEKGEGL